VQAANALFFSAPGSSDQTLQGWYEECSLGSTLLNPQTSKVGGFLGPWPSIASWLVRQVGAILEDLFGRNVNECIPHILILQLCRAARLMERAYCPGWMDVVLV
jgi:hypothetical protein